MIDYVMTHEQIGDQLGISKAMVYKIERQALAKARAHLLALGLKPEDLAPCLTADNRPPEVPDGEL